MPRAQSLEKPQTSQPGGRALYEQDFSAWVEEQVEALRSDQTHRLDSENLAEEIEDLGRSQRRAVKGALIIILSHLLKYRYQPDRRTNSWRATIREYRRRVRDELADSPRMRPIAIFCRSRTAVRRKPTPAFRQAQDHPSQEGVFLKEYAYERDRWRQPLYGAA